MLYSDIFIQDIKSVKCGEFCIGFINKVYNVKGYEIFIKKIDDVEMPLNDYTVNDLLKKTKKYKTLKNI